MAYSLDTDSFLCAFSRFLARRGPIKILRSDNGTNFTRADRDLAKQIAEWNKSSAAWMLQHKIEWQFQPPGASHMGGIWEREIRTIRKVLNGLLTEQKIRLCDERLNTLLCEAESILNNRPIAGLSSDIEDLEPLTPNHLLLVRSCATFPPGLFEETDLYLKRRWKQVQYLSDLFWRRWKKEYLPILQLRAKWSEPQRVHKVGDLVLLMDQNLPRNQWSVGRIVKVHPDVDGYVRSAEVRMSRPCLKTKASVLARPITKLVLLAPVESL